MGADMLISLLYLPTGSEPDWPAGEKQIEKLAGMPKKKWPTELTERCDGKKANELVTLLRADLKNVEAAWGGNHREGTSFTIGGHEILVTGGLSWGDMPTELSDSIDRLWSSGVAEACGFGERCGDCAREVSHQKPGLLLCEGCIEQGLDPQRLRAKLFARRAKACTPQT